MSISRTDSEEVPMGLVAITDSADMLEPAIGLLKSSGVGVAVAHPEMTEAELGDFAADADVILVGLRVIGTEALARLRRVGLLVRCGIGYDVIDVEAASRRGILVANVPDYCAEEVADHTMLLVLAVSRQLQHFQRLVSRRIWIPSEYPRVHRTSTQTLGIVGLGRIGARVAQRAKAFGFEMVGCDPRVSDTRATELGVRSVGLSELLELADIVTLHVPLSPDTLHMLDSEAFSVMKHGAILVNTSRGALVDLDALHEAITSGQLRGAALDVLDGEPRPPLNHPVVHHENVLVTPHVAWYSAEAKLELPVRAAEEALRFIRGEMPRNVVNRAALAQLEKASES